MSPNRDLIQSKDGEKEGFGLVGVTISRFMLRMRPPDESYSNLIKHTSSIPFMQRGNGSCN